jgi:hypothetical protein
MKHKKDEVEFYSLKGAEIWISSRSNSVWLLKPLKDGRVVGYELSLKYSYPSKNSIKKEVDRCELMNFKFAQIDRKAENQKEKLRRL